MSDYLIAISAVGLIFVLMGLGLNLQWGHAGLLNFGQVGFFAIGAYTYALLALHGIPLAVAVIAAAVTSSIAAAIIGRATIKMKEDYLAIVTLVLAEIIQLVATNSGWTGGPSGLPGVPAPFTNRAGRPSQTALLLLLVVIVIAAIFFLHRLTSSSFGLTLQAIRDDELSAEASGSNVAAFRIKSLVAGAALAGVAGAFYAMYVLFVVPDQFDAIVTFYAWVGIIIGGSSHYGAAIGTFIFVALEESTRFLSDIGLNVSDAQIARLRLLVIGLALILLLRFRPQGLFAYRRRLPKEVREVISPVPEPSPPARVVGEAGAP